MNKQVTEFFEELKRNTELKSEFDKIKEMYPEKDFMDDLSAEKQLQFICEKVLPFAESHGFKFDLKDIAFGDDLEELGDLSLEKISGGSNLGRKIAASTLVAINMLTLVSPVSGLAQNAASSNVPLAAAKQDNEKSDVNYGTVVNVLDKVAKELHPISEEYPLNEVDCMIFSTVIYLPLNCVPNLNSDLPQKSITISEWANNFFKYIETKDERLNLHNEDDHRVNKYFECKKNNKLSDMTKNQLKLLKLISESPRYKNIRIGDFEGRYVDYYAGIEECEQFAVATYTLEDGRKIVCFRGTDCTLTGWKEDLDLSWSKKVIAQEHALKYLRRVFDIYPNDDYFLTGHSKGGNLALYSSFYLCNESKYFFNRLMGIFNYDGPGLNTRIVSDIDAGLFDEISKKLVTYVPQSSVIGRIMDYTSKGKFYCVNSSVKEAADVLLQHDSLTWNVAYDYDDKELENKFESNVIQTESKFMADATAFFVESVDNENSVRIFLQWVFDFMVNNNISMDDDRSITQIFRDVFYNYFIRNKSIDDIISIMFAPSTVISLSESEQESFKDVLKITFLSLLKSYWGMHIELNKKMGLTPELDKALEKLVNSNFAYSEIYNVAKVVKNDFLTWENIKKFLKKLYGV